MKDITLKSGNAYSLSELFSEDRKIIIPDMQRDYCWGDNVYGEKKNEDLVTKFSESLFDVFSENKENKEVQLGMIYAYESPDNHIQLCDGQQRITTLYLLMGLLHKKTNNNSLKDCLISTFEWENDDKECRLQYAIRESTLYFLNDLVDNCFINNQEIKTIKEQSWYFKEYDLDPTIQSMIKALVIIEKELANKTPQYLDVFSTFLMKNLTFLYFDMQNRDRGEDMFVIINTTGEPLTPTDNLKPILLSDFNDPKFSAEWEKRETYFWKNKKQNEVEADNGVNDFLTWYLKIVKQDDKFELINFFKKQSKEQKEKALTEIEKYFNKIPVLINALQNDVFKSIEREGVNTIQNLRSFTKKDEIEEYILLPLLAFIVKFEDESNTYQFLRRLRKNYFDYIWVERKGNYVNWRYILQIIEKSNSLEEALRFDYLDSRIKQITNVPLNQWYNVEEQLKVPLTEHKSLLEIWEDDTDFMGDLSFLFKTAKCNDSSESIPALQENDTFEITKLQKIFNDYQKTIGLLRKKEDIKNTEYKLSNLFRLFRLFIECDKVGHIYKASGDFEGVLFSTLNRNHLNKVDFMNLLNSEDLTGFCENFVKEQVKKQNIFDLSEFSVDKFIKGWLSLKVFHANQENVLLRFHDGNETGVAAYIDKNGNKLIESMDFDWDNGICGFGVRSGGGRGNRVHYTNSDLLCKSHIIDTPFSDVAFDKDKRTPEEIEGNQKTIAQIRALIEA